jgi:serine/threonine protein kinase
VRFDGLDGGQQAAAALRHEFETLLRLRHRSVVKVHGWAEESRYAFYVSEHVHGVPLHALVASGNMMLPGVMAAYGRGLETVAHLHAQGLAHGDLSPVNIMVRREGSLTVPVLVGFGMARVTSRALLESGELADVIDFVSPEHAAFLLRGPAPSAWPLKRTSAPDSARQVGKEFHLSMRSGRPDCAPARGTRAGPTEYRLSTAQSVSKLSPRRGRFLGYSRELMGSRFRPKSAGKSNP